MRRALTLLFLVLAASLPCSSLGWALPALQDGSQDAPQDEGDAPAAGLEDLGKQAQEAAGELLSDPAAFAEKWWGKLQTWVVERGPLLLGKVFLFLVLLLLARFLSRLAARLVRRTMTSRRVAASDMLTNFAVTIARNVVLFLGVLFAMASVGISIGPFLAAFGVVGFVVGFALQDTMGNFAAGVMILLYKPFDVGDFVNVGGTSGTVLTMSIVSTTLKTGDNQRIVVPNGKIWGNTITNVTANPTRRVDLTASISYEDDVAKAEEVLGRIADEHELVLKDPAPVIRLHELADSSVNFTVRLWASTGDYWAVYWDVLRSIKTEFDAAGLSIPYPQRDVHLHQEAGAGGAH